MKKFRKMLIVTAIFLLSLSGCADEEKTSGISAEEMRFEGILVGETSYEDLKNLDITPLEDIDMSALGNLTTDSMSGHYLSYDGFEVFADEKVQSINISAEYTGTFWSDLQINDSLAEVLSKLPQEPQKYVLEYNSTTLIPADENYTAHLVIINDENGTPSLKVLALNADGGIILQLEFDAEDKLKSASINKPSNN